MNRKQGIFVKDKSSSFVVNCMKIIDGHKIMTVYHCKAILKCTFFQYR